MKIMFVSTVAAFAVGSAFAQPKTYEGSGGGIPDLGTTSFTLFVPDSGPFTTDNVTINGFAHTWVGDLTVSLTHNGQTVVLFDRPGVPQGAFGNENDLNGSYVFRDGFAQLSETSAVPAGTYGPAQSLAGLDGLDKFGIWTLTISDQAASDTGSITGWSIGLANIPGPGSLALLGLGGVLAGRRRR